MDAETIQQMEDIDTALSSAIAHSGAGPQRTRWEALQALLRADMEAVRRRMNESRNRVPPVEEEGR